MNQTVKRYKILAGVFLLFIFSFVNAFSQDEVNLYDGAIPNKIGSGQVDQSFDAPIGKIYSKVGNPTLKIYLPSKEKNTGKAVIICPGGSYTVLAYDLEGTDVAKRFAKDGIAGIVLKYRLPDPSYWKNKDIVPLQDAQRALVLVRENASKWGINPGKVGIMGSSAGGHLASTVGTHFEKCYAPNPNNISVRPDFMILNYPVISFADSLTHYGSRLRLIGNAPIPDDLFQLMRDDPKEAERRMGKIPVTKEKIREFSNELHVSSNTPPAFVVHAVDDATVKVQNSILFIASLQQAGVKVGCFFYAKGGHGFGIHNRTCHVQWIDSCIQWLNNL